MSWSKTSAIFLLSIFTLCVKVTPACSTTITTYSDLASWQAATTGDQTDTFTGLAPSGNYTTYPGGILEGGVEFIGISGTTGVADTSSGSFGSFANYGTGDAGWVSGSTGVTITLPTAVTAFSINLFTSGSIGGTWTVTTLSQPSSVTNPTSNSEPPAFFGVTSDTAFSSVTLTPPAGYTYAFFDNFSWGTAQTGSMDPVPEAGTSLLIGTGLVAFAIFRRRHG